MVMSFGYALPISYSNVTASSAHDHQFFEIESSGGAKAARLRAIKTTVTNEMGEPQWFLIAACVALGVLSLIGVVSQCDERGMTQVCYVRAISASSSMNKPLTTPSTCFGRNGS